MKISAKARYGLAAMVSIAINYDSKELTNLISISEKLGISKIYLEQVFSLLKQADLVSSIKGAQGGYQLTRMPQQITVYDVLSAIDFSLFQKAEETVSGGASHIETAIQLSAFQALDCAVKSTLENINIQELANEAEKHDTENGYMFYI